MKIGQTSQNVDLEYKKGGRKSSSARHCRRFILLWIAALATWSTEGEKKKPASRREGGAPSIIKQRTVQVRGSKYVKQVSWLAYLERKGMLQQTGSINNCKQEGTCIPSVNAGEVICFRINSDKFQI